MLSPGNSHQSLKPVRMLIPHVVILVAITCQAEEVFGAIVFAEVLPLALPHGHLALELEIEVFVCR